MFNPVKDKTKTTEIRLRKYRLKPIFKHTIINCKHNPMQKNSTQETLLWGAWS